MMCSRLVFRSLLSPSTALVHNPRIAVCKPKLLQPQQKMLSMQHERFAGAASRPHSTPTKRWPNLHLDPVRLIINDHKKVFDTYFAFRLEEANPDPTERFRIGHKLIKLLTVHSSIEEDVLYPEVKRRLEGGEALVTKSVVENDKIERGLAELDHISPEHPRFPEKLYEVMEVVEKHIDDEEMEILPRLKASMSTEELTRLGAAMEEHRQIARTRPRQHLPPQPERNPEPGKGAAPQETTSKACGAC